jgi:HAD superfamily hydrolase (TIGR01509 family)
MKKPHKKFYQLLFKKSQLKPEELVFIDDSEPNIIAAKKLKMNVILFQNARQLKKDLKKIGVKT